MPPKRRGRPPGTKNKKTLITEIKEEPKPLDQSLNKSCVCGETFTNLKSFNEHAQQCKNETISNLKQELCNVKPMRPTLACKECPKRFKFEANFREHMRIEHSKLRNSVACPQCPVKCPNRKYLNQHVIDVHNRKVYACEHCNKQFVRYTHVLRHLAQKGCDGNGISVFPCDICNAKFSRKDNLMVHLRLQHITKKQFQCKQCPYSTCTFNRLIIHVKHVHEKNKHLECHHCGKLTSSRAAMTKHLEIHGDKKFSCDVCGYTTYTIEVIRRHVLTHVEEKPYKCKLCTSSFIQRSQLLKHIEKHTSNTCNICDKVIRNKTTMILHMKEHMGNNQLTCPVENCRQSNRVFPNETSLRAHVKNHIEDRPFTCEVCNKGFRDEMTMRRHVSSHTLERPRRCMYCVAARAYVRGMQLVRHVRKAHPAVFKEHLAHVRQVMGFNLTLERVKKSELESILNVLDAEADRILEGYGEGVLYGGMQEVEVEGTPCEITLKSENNPLMAEEELAENLNKLLSRLIDEDTLLGLGWPDDSVDEVLEKVISHCGAKPADRDKWTRVQCLRENAKHLFLYVVEDKNVTRMLGTQTIDQIIQHILEQVSDDADKKEVARNMTDATRYKVLTHVDS